MGFGCGEGAPQVVGYKKQIAGKFADCILPGFGGVALGSLSRIVGIGKGAHQGADARCRLIMCRRLPRTLRRGFGLGAVLLLITPHAGIVVIEAGSVVIDIYHETSWPPVSLVLGI